MARTTETTETSIQTSTNSNTRTNSRPTKPKNTKKNAVSNSVKSRISSLSVQKPLSAQKKVSKDNKTISRKRPLKLDIISTEQRLQLIRELAYSFAEQRGFIAGDEQADWLQAEQKIDASLIN